MTTDIPTMFLVIIVACTTLALSVGTMTFRRNRDGLFFWAVALALNAGAYALFALRDQISDLLSIVVANGMVAAAFAMLAEGVFLFHKRPPPRWLVWTPVLVTVVGFFLLLDSLLLRVVSGSAIFAVQASLVLAVMLQKRRETTGRGQHLIVVSLAMMVTTYVLRGFGAATGMVQMTSVTASNSVQVITFLSTLVCAILISLGFVMMAKERADERNRVLSIQDELTGLANRRCLNEALDSELARAQRSRQAMALLMVDIDLFKKFNDRYGHQAGDDCLRNVACNLRSCAKRAGDLAARYGGEEFVLILPNTNISQARQMAQVMCQSIASLCITHEDSPEGKVTVSIGAAAMSDGVNTDAASLLRAADEALYRAKRGGRNQVQLAVQLPHGVALGIT